ncbi:ABC transporter permease [Actinoplanes sp. DH11]|uniref:ABC transporter permease n=1 Tax=Actinoplanes sp. DH11 TaxID=2857011 RepID=UPI001E42CCA0|nr:ABC transporter permease [Actinoplanes sp. DH11]
MSLARAESRRLVKRRLTKVIVIGVLLVLAAVVAGSWFSSEKVGAAQVAAAKAEADRNYQEALRSAAADKEKCLAAQGTPEASQWPADCNQLFTPTIEDYNYEWYMPATFVLREEFPLMVAVFALVLAAAAFLVGASFVGAEWNSGGMMNLLLWRPQRLRVLGTKLAVFLGWVTVLALVLGAAWTGLFRLLAEYRGSTENMTSGVWQSFGLTGLRGLAVILAAGALGFALASLGRHTGMALGALVAFGALDIGAYIMASLAGLSFPDLWFVPYWLIALLTKEFVTTDWTSCDYSSTAGCEPATFTMTWQTASIGLAAVTVLIVGASMLTMRKRDIT